MAIDHMKKVTLLCPVHAADRLNRTLHDLGIVELSDAQRVHADTIGVLNHCPTNTAVGDLHLSKISFILNLIDELLPEKKSFVQGLTPTPLIVEPEELTRAVGHVDLNALFTQAQEIDDAHKGAERRIAEVDNQLEALKPFHDLSINVTDFKNTTRVTLIFGTLPTARLDALAARKDAEDAFAWEIVVPGIALRSDAPKNGGDHGRKLATQGKRTRIVAAFLPEDAATARQILASEQFEEVPLPNVPGKVRDRIRELQGDRNAAEEQLRLANARVAELTGHRHELQVLRAHWDSMRRQEMGRSEAVAGRWIHMVTGYTRARDVEKLGLTLKREVPEVVLSTEEPVAGESVPVSITLPKLIRPVQMLVNLFGLPPYAAFDPSPFIFINFLLFFGICFGDVGYGLMLTALGAYIAYKTRAYQNVSNFAMLLLFAGISTTIFGMLFGSWLGDLYNPEYLGKDNFLLAIKDKFMILDPLADPVSMLLVALGLGMLNQFYGITLKAYGALRQGDWVTAVCDGLFWLIALPGLVIMISTMFVELPPLLFNIALAMFGLGALGLLLTQGRNEKGIFSKVSTGVISLYGIVGSYGCAAFIGDTLSYCRLLALALTTSIVALTVNMIAGLVGDVPYVGPILFVVILVVGHVFNFSISLLGAFVHAMRLIFVEFFGRFYEGGAKPFMPFGFDSPSCMLNRTASTKL